MVYKQLLTDGVLEASPFSRARLPEPRNVFLDSPPQTLHAYIVGAIKGSNIHELPQLPACRQTTLNEWLQPKLGGQLGHTRDLKLPLASNLPPPLAETQPVDGSQKPRQCLGFQQRGSRKKLCFAVCSGRATVDLQ